MSSFPLSARTGTGADRPTDKNLSLKRKYSGMTEENNAEPERKKIN